MALLRRFVYKGILACHRKGSIACVNWGANGRKLRTNPGALHAGLFYCSTACFTDWHPLPNIGP
jgi:hypothetical protein